MWTTMVMFTPGCYKISANFLPVVMRKVRSGNGDSLFPPSSAAPYGPGKLSHHRFLDRHTPLLLENHYFHGLMLKKKIQDTHFPARGNTRDDK